MSPVKRVAFDVPLRDYMERLIADHDKHIARTIEDHDKAHQAEHKAVQLQAAEYERRLDLLNHAHAEALRVQVTYLTKDKFEDWQKMVNEELARREARINTLEQFKAKAALLGGVIGVFSGLIGAAIMRAFS